MNDRMQLPSYDLIITKCIDEMKIKFANYGNDWLTSDDLYWKERLAKEIKEYIESMTIDSEKRKLLNIINIAAMAYETTETNRGCRQHIVEFNDVIMSEHKTYYTDCNVCHKSLFIERGIIREVEKNE